MVIWFTKVIRTGYGHVTLLRTVEWALGDAGVAGIDARPRLRTGRARTG